MFNLVTWSAIMAGIVVHTIAAICQKTAAQQATRRRMVAFFVLSLAIGFFHPVSTAIAMRGNHPNLVIAAKGGLGGMFFLIVINRVFKEKLAVRQWLAMFVIMAGTLLLQLAA